MGLASSGSLVNEPCGERHHSSCTCEKESRDTRGRKELVLFSDPQANPLAPKPRMGGGTHSHRAGMYPVGKDQMRRADSLSLSSFGQPRAGAPRPSSRGLTSQLTGPDRVALLQLDETSQVETVSEENKSLMWVLLRQLRPGMDLSRVVLPTFVLEPRSFLSKLSDYYYHGDLLSRCVTITDRRGFHGP